MVIFSRANPRRFNFDNIGDAMLTLFEVLSFKGWLDVRDVLIKSLGPVSVYRLYFWYYKLIILGPCYLHSHLHLLRLHDRSNTVCRCRNCKLFWKQRNSSINSWPKAMVRIKFYCSLTLKFLSSFTNLSRCDLKKRLKIAQPLHLPPRPDGKKFRAFIYDITQNIKFKRCVALMVLINSGLLGVTVSKGFTGWLTQIFFILLTCSGIKKKRILIF